MQLNNWRKKIVNITSVSHWTNSAQKAYNSRKSTLIEWLLFSIVCLIFVLYSKGEKRERRKIGKKCKWVQARREGSFILYSPEDSHVFCYRENGSTRRGVATENCKPALSHCIISKWELRESLWSSKACLQLHTKNITNDKKITHLFFKWTLILCLK